MELKLARVNVGGGLEASEHSPEKSRVVLNAISGIIHEANEAKRPYGLFHEQLGNG